MNAIFRFINFKNLTLKRDFQFASTIFLLPTVSISRLIMIAIGLVSEPLRTAWLHLRIFSYSYKITLI